MSFFSIFNFYLFGGPFSSICFFPPGNRKEKNSHKKIKKTKKRNRPWVQGNYSGLLVQLSSVYSALRGDASGVKNEDASQGFVRSTTKYWVRTADVSAVKHHILQQLPVFQYSAPEGAGAVDAGDAQLVNSVRAFLPPFFLRVQRTKTGRQRENEKLTQLPTCVLLLPQNSFTRLTSTTARWSFTTAGWTSARGRLRSASGGTGTVSEGFRSVLSTFSF